MTEAGVSRYASGAISGQPVVTPFVRAIAGETIRALIVLALVFLNFGHGAVASEDRAGFVVLDTSVLCGEQTPGTPSLGDEPCPACRIASGIGLPPASCAIAPAFGLLTAIAFEDLTETGYRPAFGHSSGPRAPPAA
jgi:hypothetical protein